MTVAFSHMVLSCILTGRFRRCSDSIFIWRLHRTQNVNFVNLKELSHQYTLSTMQENLYRATWPMDFQIRLHNHKVYYKPSLSTRDIFRLSNIWTEMARPDDQGPSSYSNQLSMEFICPSQQNRTRYIWW